MKQVGREGKETATGRDTIDPPRRRAMAKETAALRRRLYILGALERERERERELHATPASDGTPWPPGSDYLNVIL